MTLDARSRERLEALGRTLPKKLPIPEGPKAIPGESTVAKGRGDGPQRGGPHPLERDLDPADLFRALMQASPDGNVPPHLLERLKEVEGANTRSPSNPSAASTSTKRRPTPPATGQGIPPRAATSQAPPRGSADLDLYTAFAQMLFEDDGNA